MRYLIILFLFLSACAEEKKTPVSCETLGPYQVVFPDGVERKTDINVCSNGCATYYYTGNPDIRFETCKNQ